MPGNDNMGSPLRNYVKDICRYTFPAILGNTDDEVSKTLEVLYEPRRQMITEAIKSYNRNRAAEMAYMSALTYKLKELDLDEVESTLKRGEPPLTKQYRLLGPLPNPNRVSQIVQNAGPRGFVADSDDELVVSIKGSDDLFDWNINSLVFKGGSSKAHEGYHAMGGWTWANLRDVFPPGDIRNRKRIIFTGHSLGGAVARVAARLTAKDRVIVEKANASVEVYTFGAAQIGDDWKKVSHLSVADISEYNFVTAGDVVPGFGLSDDYFSGYLIGAKNDIYKYDASSREARFVRLFELIRVARYEKKYSKFLIRLILMKIRRSQNDKTLVENDVLLSLNPHNFPPQIYLPEHKIHRYLEALTFPSTIRKYDD